MVRWIARSPTWANPKNHATAGLSIICNGIFHKQFHEDQLGVISLQFISKEFKQVTCSVAPRIQYCPFVAIVMHVGSITTFRLFQNNALAEIRAKNHSMVSTRVLPAMAHGLILWWCINPNRSTVDRYVTFHKFTTRKDARRVCPVDGLEINIWNTNRYCITR